MATTIDRVMLYGMWASPFVRRVELVLKVKGISYEHVEEDLTNKSQDLLLYNPVHKKVPVLLHNDKIIEYIEDTWKSSPSVFPTDPYERAKVRFWANFIDQKILEQLRTVLIKRGEEDIKEMRENLEKLEANTNDIFPSGKPPVVGESMSLLDILMCTYSGVIESLEEALEVKIMDPNKYPLTITWMKAFDSLEIVRETTPSHEKLVSFFKAFGKK
uniref:Glutathione S-transferase n=1 Tax=Knorringia sibirica TaxID=328376 RepID=B2Z451_9CARY|nr:glutathione S-transferase [Knorringia sibirica]